MTTPPRPPGAYVHGTEGPVVIVGGRVAAWLERHANLRAIRTAHRGIDPEVDAVMVALGVAAATWRQRVAASADHGTEQAKQAAPVPRSTLTTKQAATLLDMSERGIRDACAEGRLPAERHGGQWAIAREDAEHYRAGRAA